MQRYCITLAIFALGLGDVASISFTAEEGPFEAILQNTSSCITEPPWFQTNITTYTSNGRRLLRGSIITKRQLKNVKFHIIVNYMGASKMKILEVKNQNCHKFLVSIVLHALQLPYDAMNCTMKPASTEFSELDVDKFIHSVVQSLWYGAVQIRWEITMPSVKFFCHNINLQIVKIKAENIVNGTPQ